MKNWHKGYMAAMIDAECHLGIQREMSKNRVTPAYVIRWELAMTNKQTIDFVNSILPSAKVIHYFAREHRLPYWRVRLVHREVIQLLKCCLPYLQGKRRQAELCLELNKLRKKYSPSRRHVGKAKFQCMPPIFAEKADIIFREFRSLQLNKKPRNKIITFP